MQETIGKHIKQYEKFHKRRRKYISIFIMLALVVALGVIWQLKLTGISMTSDVQCGKKEHKHTEKCYEKVLVCGLEETEEEPVVPVHKHTDECYETQKTLMCEKQEHLHIEECYDENGELICDVEEHQHSEEEYVTEEVLICEKEETEAVEKKPAHEHTDACYEKKLVCQKEEHTHSIMCMCDKNADVESEADWEATLPKELKNVWADDLLAVADSQMGYKESSRNFVLNEDGKKTRGYTRYGQWYGNQYGHWCAMFVSWCLNYAEIPEEAIPYEAGCYAWTVELDKMGLYHSPDEYSPEAGDIIFFYRNGKIGHVGIVESVDKEKSKVHTIEGNSGNAVRRREYKLDSKKITGYASLKEAEEKYAVDYLGENPEQTLEAEIYADESCETLLDEENKTIVVSGKIPKDAVVKAYPVEDAEIEGQQVLGAYDISIILKDGSIYEPDEPLKVSIKLPELKEEEDAEKSSVYYIPEDGKAEKIDTNVEKSTAEFEAEHFSVYAVALSEDTGIIDSLEKLQSALLATDTTDPIIIENIDITDNVELDLNGHTIDASAGGFTVKDKGTLIITDSIGATDTQNEGVTTSANDAGKLATLDGNTLTYYVTETSVTDDTIGATTEKLVTHTVELKGKIVGGGVTVENGGSFTMNGGTICGVTNGYAVNSTGGIVTINDGYIVGNGGGIKADGGTVEFDGGVIAGNTAEWGGGIHVENGQFNMFGGIISGNDAHEKGGGGVYVNQSIALLYHGYITNNVGADNTPEYTGGGGVLCHSGCTVEIMSGADYNEPMYITANKACSGGGITAYNMLNGVGNKITMNDGYVTGNLATNAEGGGIAIRAESNAIIMGGYITNNIKATTESWGGGGIFGQEYSGITILHALITDNSSGGFGGGVTGCSTGTVLIQDTEGGAIYGNHAEGEHMADATQKMDDHAAQEDPVFMQGDTYQDYFCALVSMVKGEMLGGGSENWYGSADGIRVNTDSADDILTSSIRMGLNANPSTEDIQNAQKIAHVFINGNSSASHGGGVLANGILVLGNNDEQFELPGTLTIHLKKALDGKYDNSVLADYRFGFKLMDENKEEISTAYNDTDGLIIFPKIKYTKPGTYIYYIEELVPEYPNIVKDDTIYRLEVKVEKKEVVPEKGHGGIAYLCCQPTKWKLYMNDSTDVMFEDECKALTIDGHTSVADFFVDLFGKWYKGEEVHYNFNNTFADEVSIEIHKVWKDAEGNDEEDHPDSITVYLTKNGERHESEDESDKSPVTLNKDNNWSYSWSKLPGHDDNNEPIIWGIEEDVPDGWEAHLTYKKPGETEPEEPEEPEQPSGPQPVTNPEPGKMYHVGNLEISKLLVVGDGDKTWDLPQWNDQNLSNAKYEVESDETQFYLKQGESYLYFNPKTEWDGTHYFLKKSQDSKTPFSVDSAGRLYTLINDVIYYISTNAGSGITVTTDSSSVMILYTIPDTSSGGDNSGDDANNSVVTITNKPKSEEQFYGFTVKKVDAKDETIILPGAHFQLTNEQGTIMTFTQDKNGVYHYDGHWNQIEDLVVGPDGIFKIEGLPAGTYTLTEVKAPEGYKFPEGDAAKQTITLPGEGENPVVTITNSKEDGYILPEAGGTGTILYLACGLICILIPFMYGLRLKRTAKRRR